jgi:hypothetical protein
MNDSLTTKEPTNGTPSRIAGNGKTTELAIDYVAIGKLVGSRNEKELNPKRIDAIKRRAADMAGPNPTPCAWPK